MDPPENPRVERFNAMIAAWTARHLSHDLVANINVNFSDLLITGEDLLERSPATTRAAEDEAGEQEEEDDDDNEEDDDEDDDDKEDEEDEAVDAAAEDESDYDYDSEDIMDDTSKRKVYNSEETKGLCKGFYSWLETERQNIASLDIKF